MRESDLEEALLDRLQAFLLELGHRFCFEARQKRILIGDTYGFVDLVFYHRILKCHVLIELKADAFSDEHLGQLNTYVSWYRANMMSQGDNPPVGLLLCTAKDQVLVEYALAGLDSRLFVSNYQLTLPSPEELTSFLKQQRQEVEGCGTASHTELRTSQPCSWGSLRPRRHVRKMGKACRSYKAMRSSAAVPRTTAQVLYANEVRGIR